MPFNEWEQVCKKNHEEKLICVIYCYVFKWMETYLWTIFTFALTSFSLIDLLFWLHSCLLSHCEITRGIGKSLLTNSIYFSLKYNWKKKTWKTFFGYQSLGSQTVKLVSQTAWIRHNMTFILKLNLPSSCIIRCEWWFFRLWNIIGMLWFNLTLISQSLCAESLYFSLVWQWCLTLTSPST